MHEGRMAERERLQTRRGGRTSGPFKVDGRAAGYGFKARESNTMGAETAESAP